MTDKEKERIKFETEILKLATLVAVAMGGGAISLVLGELTPIRLGLAGLGLLGTVALLMTVWSFYRSIDQRIAHSQEDQ